jgi:hypothetical protein
VAAVGHVPLQRVLLAGRTVPVLGAATAGVGVQGDLRAGYSLQGAVVKQTVVVTASSAAGAGVAAALTGGAAAAAVGAGVVVTAPVTVPAVLVGAAAFGAATAVGYVGSRLWDAAFKPDAAARPEAGAQRRSEPPRPSEPPRRGAPPRSHPPLLRGGGQVGLAPCAVPLGRAPDSVDELSHGSDTGRGTRLIVSRP